jgi:Asp-tRNA(Asn)/Glu-tRNA(Gln) amidotransferase A subunit family amidase
MTDLRPSYAVLNASNSEAGSHLSVAVPSRLAFAKSSEKHLSCFRIAVKDSISLNGVKTSGSSRSTYELYPPATESAPNLQRLLDQGAVVVGKVGMSQFADTEDPTAGYVDYHCPFNPRGDGYRGPCGSSS